MKKCKVCEKLEVTDDSEIDICMDCWIHGDCCGLERLE